MPRPASKSGRCWKGDAPSGSWCSVRCIGGQLPFSVFMFIEHLSC